MTQIKIKRVYEEPADTDGYRVLVDRLWPRGMKKEYLKYDVWEKTSLLLRICVNGFTEILPDIGKSLQQCMKKNWKALLL